jgi:tetratricopeptide (TPR) repeat protein
MLPSVVEHLKDQFPHEAGNILWPILHNELVKSAFKDKSFVQALLDDDLALDEWRLGNLARLYLVHRETNWPSLRVDARNKLLKNFSPLPQESFVRSADYSKTADLATAGVWAEELLDIANVSGWGEFRQFLGIGTSRFVDQVFPQIKESLVFLYHTLADPGELLQSLKAHYANKSVLEFCAVCYCSTCFDSDDLAKKLFAFIAELPFARQVDVLKYLYQQEKKDAAGDIAGLLLERYESLLGGSQTKANPLDQVFALANQFYRSMLLAFAGKKAEGQAVWQRLNAGIEEWQAGLFLQKAQAFGDWDGSIDFSNSLEYLRNNDFDSQGLASELAALSDRVELPVSVQAGEHSPFVMAGKYRKAVAGKQSDEAGTYAGAVVEQLRVADGDPAAHAPKYIFAVDYSGVIDPLIRNDDLEHAETAIGILLEKYPTQADLLGRLAEIKEKQGDIQAALEYKLLESAVAPESASIYKRLSEYYSKCAEPGKAYKQFRQYAGLAQPLGDNDQIRLAELAYESGSYHEVEPAAAPLLEKDVTKGIALVILGKTREKQGDFTDAVACFRKAVEDDPYAPERWVYLAGACRYDADDHDIIAILQDALGYLAESATIHSEMAREYYLHGNISEARYCLEKASGFAADTREGVINAGSLMAAMGDRQKAFVYYQDYLRRFGFDAEIARLTALNALEAREFEAAENTLLTLMGQIKPSADDIALYILARLEGQSPIFADDLSMPAEELASLNAKMDEGLQLDATHLGINLLRAEIKAFVGDYEGARQIYTMLIEHENTSHWKILGGYGFASMKLGDLHTALAALQESYSINPEQPKLEQYLAEVYLEVGLPSDAQAFADKVFQQKPNDLNTLLWYAGLMSKMGQWEGVTAALINAYHINPGDAQIMLRLAEGFVRTGKNKDAAQLTRLLIAMPDLDAEQLLKIANLLAQMDEWKTAIDLLEQSIERGYPEEGQIHFSMAAAFQQLGDYENALAQSQQAVNARPADRYLLIHQADLLYILEKPQAALSCLEHCETLAQETETTLFANPFFGNLDEKLHFNDWLDAIDRENAVLSRKVLLLKKLNRNDEAKDLAEKAYKAGKSADLLLAQLALAVRSCDFSSAKALLKETRRIEHKDHKQAAALLNLRMDILLDDAGALKKDLAEDDTARFSGIEWLCAQCLVDQQGKRWEAAMQDYRQARVIWANRTALRGNAARYGLSGYKFTDEILADQPYWLWLSAANLLLWDDALDNFRQNQPDNADHLAFNFGYLKALTLAGEWKYLSDELELEKRKPAVVLDEGQAAGLLQKLTGQPANKTRHAEIQRWINRFKIVYANKPVNVKGISDELHMPADIEFLTGLLRREGKYAPASEITEKLGAHFKSAWQQALCYKMTDRQKAVQLLADEIEHSAGLPFPLIVMGQIAEENGDVKGAYAAYRKAVNIWKDEPKWQLHCAELAEKCGDSGATVLHLRKAMDLGYQKLETARKIGQIHQGRAEYQKVINTLEPLLRDGVQDFDMLLQLGAAHLELGDSKKAFEYAEQAKLARSESEQPLLLYARISDAMGQTNAAMEYARKALEHKPGDEDIIVLLSQYIEKSGNPDEALQLLENVVVSGEAGDSVVEEYVKRKFNQGGSASVLDFLDHLKEKGGLSDDLHIYLARAYYEDGQMAKAEQEAAEAVKIDPESEEMNYLLAVLKHAGGQLDLASHYAARAIQINPHNMQAYRELAEIYRDKNEPVNALEVYKKAIKANPENHRGYFQAGLLLRETRDYQESEIMLKQAANLAPDDLNIHRQLGAVIALNLVHNAQEEKTIP